MKNTGSTTVNDILQQGAETNLLVPPLLQIDDPQQRAMQKLTQAEENTKIKNHKREEADQNTEKNSPSLIRFCTHQASPKSHSGNTYH